MKKNPLKLKAESLVRQLEQERAGRNLMFGKVVRTQNTAPIVLGAEPELQAAFVECVVEIYAKLGTPKGKKVTEWFRGNASPAASAEIVRLLLRRGLPFTDAMLAGMFKKLSQISFLGALPFREQLALGLEKFARKNVPSAELRQQAKRYADVVGVRHLPQAEVKFWREEWGLPGATDRKTAARIDQLLGR